MLQEEGEYWPGREEDKTPLSLYFKISLSFTFYEL